jgi:DNA-binding GntR family transcriptional regulator
LIVVGVASGSANATEREKLALHSPQASVLRVTCVRYDAGFPLLFEEVILPLDRFPGLTASSGDVPEISELSQRHGLSLGRVTELISIVPGTKDVAMHLGIAAGTDVMKMDRITETADGQPIEWRVAFARITN